MSEFTFSHMSVLLNECIEALDIRDGYTYIDATAGGGGHSLEIAKDLVKTLALLPSTEIRTLSKPQVSD